MGFPERLAEHKPEQEPQRLAIGLTICFGLAFSLSFEVCFCLSLTLAKPLCFCLSVAK